MDHKGRKLPWYKKSKKKKKPFLRNCGPITCLPMVRKILNAQRREEIYYSLAWFGQFPEEQKRCRKGTRGTDDLLFIDQHIFKKVKTKRKNVVIAWIDFKKAYVMVTLTWIIKCLKILKNIRQKHKVHHESHGIVSLKGIQSDKEALKSKGTVNTFVK